MSFNIQLLIRRSNLSEEQKKILDSPPWIVKMTLEDLVSFSNKPRRTPPKLQNAWLIFLKNFCEYSRRTFPDKPFSMTEISCEAAAIWNNLEGTDLIKIYFKILAKIAEENRKMTFFENHLVQSSVDKKWRWKVIVNNEIATTSPSPFLIGKFVHYFSSTFPSSTSDEVDILDPVECETLVQDMINIPDDNISTNESATIIPQANLIQAMIMDQRLLNYQQFANDSRNDFDIATHMYYCGIVLPIDTDDYFDADKLF